jgi:hypothetical protein
MSEARFRAFNNSSWRKTWSILVGLNITYFREKESGKASL